jgi:hypothetical protein
MVVGFPVSAMADKEVTVNACWPSTAESQEVEGFQLQFWVEMEWHDVMYF